MQGFYSTFEQDGTYLATMDMGASIGINRRFSWGQDVGICISPGATARGFGFSSSISSVINRRGRIFVIASIQ